MEEKIDSTNTCIFGMAISVYNQLTCVKPQNNDEFKKNIAKDISKLLEHANYNTEEEKQCVISTMIKMAENSRRSYEIIEYVKDLDKDTLRACICMALFNYRGTPEFKKYVDEMMEFMNK